jgi:hypothetical protein
LPGTLAAEWSLKVEDQPVPAGVSADIRSLLAEKCVRLVEGSKPAMEFWFRKELPLAATPKETAKALDSLKQPVLLGALQVSSDLRDYRDDELPKGVYTLRLGLQPSDGNHLGTSDYAYFAILIPAKDDTKPDGVADYKALTKASSKETSTGHPIILSLRPVSDGSGTIPSLQTPAAEHKSVRVKVPGRAGDARADVIFDLVYEGKGHK